MQSNDGIYCYFYDLALLSAGTCEPNGMILVDFVVLFSS
jgi:hypothetical protein